MNLKSCPYCKKEDTKIQEVDKEDMVLLPGIGFSRDKIFEKRPWGSFSVIVDKEFVKIKELIINPKSKISLQLHRKREEFWVVLKGKGILTLGLDEIPVEEGQPIHIRKYEMHSIDNYTDEDLVIIEIQKGVCKEDDIIRIEDDYGRLDKEN
jgi:mannose-6-phosphate isomerase-like protein (cupin superfamily)